MNRRFLSLSIVLAASLAMGQGNSQPNQARQEIQAGQAPQDAPAAPKPATSAKGGSAAQKKFAKQLLQQARSEIGKFEPGPRAYLGLELAKGMLRYDKPGALAILREAFTATQGMDANSRQERSDKQQMQGWVVQQVLLFGAPQAEELLPQAEGTAKEMIRTDLIEYYTNKKDFDHAEELARGFNASEEKFPYKATAKLMLALPEEHSGERVSLFSEALADYRQRSEEPTGLGSDDMATFIVRFASQLPKPLVTEAIDEVLNHAKKDSQDNDSTVSISTAEGAASFGSKYDFRLFEVLPALRAIDPDRAEKLLAEDRGVNGALQTFPQGMQSFDPSLAGKQVAKDRPMSFWVSDKKSSNAAPNGGGMPSEAMTEEQEMAQIAAIMKGADDNPKQALAQAESLPTKQGSRAHALGELAQAMVKKNPGIAKEAALDMTNGTEDMMPAQQMRNYAEAIRLLLKLEETDAAEKTLQQGLELAAKQHDKDAEASDPDLAMRAMWPSAGIYKEMVRLAGKISTKAAMDAVDGIHDEEIQTFARIQLADEWLGVPSGLTVMKDMRKSGKHSTMMSQSDDEEE